MPSTGALVGNIKDLLGAGDAKPERKVGKELDKDAFLQLLVTQLKHQDPMKPMDDASFIAEMAQFSSLEQMQNMNKLLESQQNFQALSQSSSMIGKYVSIISPGEDGTVVKGKVDEFRMTAGKITVVVDGEEYDAAAINKVSDKPFGLVPGATSAAATAATAAAKPAATTTAAATKAATEAAAASEIAASAVPTTVDELAARAGAALPVQFRLGPN